MLHRLRRHPFPVVAHFRHSLVVTYALPAGFLEQLLPPGLVLDAYGDDGFVAIALVETEGLRPSFAPRAFGTRFFLTGYRIFVRPRTAPSLRGLYILRSDADRRAMVVLGNVFTHYRYGLADVRACERDGVLEIEVRTPAGEADVGLAADLGSRCAPLPDTSPFPDLATARKYAGPLPYTFDYEAATNSLVAVRGVRSQWNPESVRVDVRRATFFAQRPFSAHEPRLANAFHVGDVAYRWERGRLIPVG